MIKEISTPVLTKPAPAPEPGLSTRRAVWRLILLSLVSLFAELLIIRWMSADIRAFTIFKSFPLVTFFVGLGLGFTDVSNKFSRWLPFAFLLFAIEMEVANLCQCGKLVFPSNSFDWCGNVEPVYLAQFMILFALLLSIPFLLALTIGSTMAPIFNRLKPLTAYSVNVIGALAGSILFGILSFLYLPPWALLVVPVVIMLFLFEESSKKKKILARIALIASIAISWAASAPDKGMVSVFWSPYQRLDVEYRTEIVDSSKNRNVRFVSLYSNHCGYQSATDLTPEQCEKWNKLGWLESIQNRWMLPYKLRPFEDTLIVASGLGSDVAQALHLGAKSIDAVDIDPVIIRLGKKLNPLKPYADPRVHVFCDDARHYFATCKKTYDLVVFSHLDSHTVVGTGAGVRLDNYIYTKESIRQALHLVRPDGLLVLSFHCSKDWFTDRLFNTISSATGYAPVVLRTDKRTAGGVETYLNTVFILGNAVKSGSFRIPESLKEQFVVLKLAESKERVLTDDWPYLYLENRLIDRTYLAVLAEVLAIAFFVSLPVLRKPAVPAVHWQLFFMGAAFMLLELQFISRLALLFGATWVTTSIVINCVLTMILFANALVIKQRQFFQNKISMLYAALLVSLFANYLLPISEILCALENHHALACTLICLITFLPVIVVAIIFAVSFERVTNNSRALAFNMLGAVVGALLEYMSNYTGINALLLIVMLFYAISYWFARAGGKNVSLN